MLYRYLFRESMLPFAFTTLILTALMITTELANIISLVIEGRYEQAAAYKVIGMYVPMLLPDIIPPAYFLAMLISFNRLSQDNERTIILTTGQSERTILLRHLIYTAIPVTVVLAIVTLWLSPQYHYEFESYRVEQKNRPLTNLVEAGKFYSLPGNQGLILVEESEPKTGILWNVITVRNSDEMQQILIAEQAELVPGSASYLGFQNGNVYQFSSDDNTVTTQHFESYAVQIPVSNEQYSNTKLNGMSTKGLLSASDQWRRSELTQRVIYPFIIPVLCIWALGLTQSRPRQGKVGAIALGLGLYIVYSFLTRTVHAAVTTSKIPLWADFWWMHVLAFLVGYGLFFRRKGW